VERASAGQGEEAESATGRKVRRSGGLELHELRRRHYDKQRRHPVSNCYLDDLRLPFLSANPDDGSLRTSLLAWRMSNAITDDQLRHRGDYHTVATL
jgi:hypothetical protein